MGRKRKEPSGDDSALPNEETALEKSFREYTNEETTGILNAISEAMEELETARQAMNFISADEEEEEFAGGDVDPTNFQEGSLAQVEDNGNLMTTEEVALALRREETSRSGKEYQAGPGSETTKKGMLRSRLKLTSKAQKKKEKNEHDMEVGIFGTTAKPGKWSLSNYLQSVASTREKRVIAVSAWLLALIGLIVSLAFVTKDFIESKNEMASTVRFFQSETMNMPPLWICTMDTSLPNFGKNLGKQFPGQPLLWIDFFKGSRSLLNITYPYTHEMPQLGTVHVNALGQPCSPPTVMNPSIFEEENKIAPNCFHCFSLDGTPRIEFERSHHEDEHDHEAGTASKMHATIRMARHSVFSKCRMSQMGLSRDAFAFFTGQIKTHHQELKARGILDFGVFDPTNGFHNQYLWPLYRMGFGNATVDFAVYDVVDMLCNVYLFSDYFYPSSAKAVRYKFNDKYYRWERTGEGPYYPSKFDEYYSGVSSRPALYSELGAIGTEKYENRSMYAGQSLHIVTNRSMVDKADVVASLEPFHMASLRFTRNMIHETESYEAKVSRTILQTGDVRAVHYVYFMDVSFENFMTRVVSKQLTVSWSAFAADFFGLTSLFLDVSVYTLIVAPLIMRARKKALIARKNKVQAHHVV